MQVLLIYRHCFVALSTEVCKWPPKTGCRKSPISENWLSFGRMDGRLAKSLVMYNEKERKLKLPFVIISWRLFWQWNSLIMFWLQIKIYSKWTFSTLWLKRGLLWGRNLWSFSLLWGYCFPALYCFNKFCFLCFTWLVAEC